MNVHIFVSKWRYFAICSSVFLSCNGVLCLWHVCRHCRREHKHDSCFVCFTSCVWCYPTCAVSGGNGSQLADWKPSVESGDGERSHLLSSGLTPSYRPWETASASIKSTHSPITDQSALSRRVDGQQSTAHWIQILLCSCILSWDRNRVIQLFLVVSFSAVRILVRF